MSLGSVYRTTRIIETLENYAGADKVEWKADDDTMTSNDYFNPYNDEYFWNKIFNLKEAAFNKTFEFNDVGLSEWVARVPGLYYNEGSQLNRRMAEKTKVYVSGKWKHYSPSGKSQKVVGGIGTINLPDENDYHLVSISFMNNASTGIPVLIHQEIWEHHKLYEGKFIGTLKGKWKKMSMDWSQRFPSMADIPRGYIVVESPDDIRVSSYYENEVNPTLFHPFSIMEYEKEGAVFYDFVYVTVDSLEENYRDKIREFFGEYEYFENRNGRYLIEPFVNNPLLNNCMYRSPQELRNNPTGNSHLQILLNKIRQETYKGQTIENIKIAMDNNCDIDQIKRISDMIGVNPNRWFSGKSLVDETAALLSYCIDRNNKIEELVDALSLENDNMFL